MATYDEIYGKRVEVFDSDPTLNSTYEGQVWYNSASGTLKSVVSFAAFSTGTPTINNFGYGGWANQGTQTAAFIAAPPGSPPPAPTGKSSNEYDGTGWTSGGNLGSGRYGIGSCGGTQTSCIITAGSPGSGLPMPTYNFAESYNGTSFSAETALGTARGGIGGGGASETAAIVATGDLVTSPFVTTATESWNGSSWTSLNSAPTATRNAGSTGVLTSLMVMGGTNNTTTLNFTAEFDGSNWTAGTNYPAANRGSNGAGSSSTAALIVGGNNGSGTAYTEAYDYDGTTYTDIGTILTPQMNNAGSSGSTTAAIFNAGGQGTPASNNTQEFNRSINTITGAAWASAAAMNTARKALGGAYGTTTAGLVAGGHSTPNAGIADSEEFDGSSWTEGPNMNTARGWLACCGTQTAALGAGGYTAPPNTDGSAATEEYDGSTWTNGGSLSQEMYGGGGFGTQTAGVKAGGYNNTLPPGNVTAQTEEYNGSSWSTNPNSMGTARYAMTGSGPSTAGLVAGGYQYTSPAGQTTKTEEFDGTNWTTGGAMVLSRKGLSSSGNSQTNCIVFGGNASNATMPETYTGYTEAYDGTSWSTRPSMATGRDGVGGSFAGTTSSAWVAGGRASPPAAVTTVEEFTGETSAVTSKTLTTS